MILALVLEKLKAAGIRAEAAYPGRRMPAITGSVAAVQLGKVDRTAGTVTVQAHILSPAAMGGSVCEEMGLQAMEVLHGAGGACQMGGCSYDPDAQVYTVTVQAEFVCASGTEGCTPGLGFQVYAAGAEQVYATAFTAEKTAGHEALYGIGSADPAGVVEGAWRWELRLEEQIPAGEEEPDPPVEPFTLELVAGGRKEIYSECRWVSEERTFSAAGLHRVRKGIARLRQEE